MSRTGYTKEQQNKLKQLVFECSIARLPSNNICQLAHEKLDMEVTENWIGRIKRRLQRDSEKEYNRLVSTNFAFKCEYIQRIAEIKEIQRKIWEIVNKEEHLSQEDLIRLKCLSTLQESTVSLTEFYDALPAIDAFKPKLTLSSKTTYSDMKPRFVHPHEARYGHEPVFKEVNLLGPYGHFETRCKICNRKISMNEPNVLLESEEANMMREDPDHHGHGYDVQAKF